MVMLEDHGLAVQVARGWEGRMWVADLPPPAIALPVLRLGNFPLRRTRDSYGEDAAADLQPGRVVASLVEFEPRLADAGLFAASGIPEPFGEDDLDPRAVQVHRPDRAGLQRFFSIGDRAFSLYVIARRGPELGTALRDLHRMLASLRVAPATAETEDP
jgi:hypothetical protein